MCAPFAAEHDPLEAERLFSFEALERSYLETRRGKRKTLNALRFEANLEENLTCLSRDLKSGRYEPSRSVCFLTKDPKPREIVAADFRDRIVHHLLVGYLEPLWERVFIHDSYASRKGKGTHAAVQRLSEFLRRVTSNGTRRAYFIHLDIKSFFTSMDHDVLLGLLFRRSPSKTLNWLCERIVRRDIGSDAVIKSPKELFSLVPPGKSLLRAPPGKGLPIGNHTSQFFANVYLDPLDQFVKHRLKARFYIRYMDDMILLSGVPGDLRRWQAEIESFLRERLLLGLNPKTKGPRPVSCGIDFLGYVTKPRYRLVRRRVVGNLKRKLKRLEPELNGNGYGYKWIFYKEDPCEYLRSMVASYRAHFAWANSWNLRRALSERFPWVGRALHCGGGKPFWEVKGPFPCLRAQVGFFERKFPGALLVFQVGRFFEFFEGSALWASKALKLKLLRGRRRGGMVWTRIPLGKMSFVLREAAQCGVQRLVLFLERGDSIGRVKRRCAFALGLLE